MRISFRGLNSAFYYDNYTQEWDFYALFLVHTSLNNKRVVREAFTVIILLFPFLGISFFFRI